MMLGNDITIHFKGAPPVKTGAAVFVGDRIIGRTELLRISARAVDVDVVLLHDDVLCNDTIFLMETTGDAIRLVAFPQGRAVITSGTTPRQFQGASSRAELAAMVMKHKLRRFLDALYDVLSKVAEGILK